MDGENIVLIFGAGATKACGGPLTNELLPLAFAQRNEFAHPDALAVLEEFLVEQFRLKSVSAEPHGGSYPALPLLLSLLDTAIQRKQAFGPKWTVDKLRDVRASAEYAVFALLESQLNTGPTTPYFHLIRRLVAHQGSAPTIVSLNYDILVDNALINASKKPCETVPDYGCDVATQAYVDTPKWGRLFKLHGSMNWLYCPGCSRLTVRVSRKGLMRVPERAYSFPDLADSTRGHCCSPGCGTELRPVLITPSHMKDYGNPHVASVWYRAERALREATRAVFIGYSLPWDDVEVIYLLKRGLGHLLPEQITVVEYGQPPSLPADTHLAGQRYAAVFGGGIDWHALGFASWLAGPAAALLGDVVL